MSPLFLIRRPSLPVDRSNRVSSSTTEPGMVCAQHPSSKILLCLPRSPSDPCIPSSLFSLLILKFILPMFLCLRCFSSSSSNSPALMCSQRLHKPSSSNRTCLYICLMKKSRVEWEKKGKEGESAEGMNEGSVEKKVKENKKGGKGETGCLGISCSELKLSGGTVCAHVWERRGGEKREGWVLQRAVCMTPPPAPLVLISQHIWGSLCEFDRVVSLCCWDIFTIVWFYFTCFVCVWFCTVGVKINGFNKCGIWDYYLEFKHEYSVTYHV